MKTLFRILLVMVLLGVAALAFFSFAPVGPASQTFVLIKPGTPTRTIAAQLERAGVVRNAYAFLAVHALKGRRTLKAGEYSFDHPASALEVYDRMARGDVYTHTVVIPEGYNIFDIAQALETSGLTTKVAFLEVAQGERSLIADMDPQAPSLEGYLFPDTYHFSRTQTPREMAAAMVKRFRQEAQALGLTQNFHHVVTMASIVEKETAVASERPLVAGVFENRLLHRIGLATDPSVIYAGLLAGRYRGAIHQSDLQFDSPYNTYKYSGLPPGPIANPGRASLEAAMRPVTTDYLYFVADNKGGHNFARSLEEHNRNVADYRRGVPATAPK
ncbi:MAG TPA: endolytic transglycosylase MltG [Terriglobales bacterium]|nr:endolytic transglycosylase MltG [Terriglobales bacterium]